MKFGENGFALVQQTIYWIYVEWCTQNWSFCSQPKQLNILVILVSFFKAFRVVPEYEDCDDLQTTLEAKEHPKLSEFCRAEFLER